MYQAANVPVFWANSQGASHFAPIGDLGVYRGITTAWWDYQLKGDQDAADLFAGPCLGCDAEGWDVQQRVLKNCFNGAQSGLRSPHPFPYYPVPFRLARHLLGRPLMPCTIPDAFDTR